MGVRLQSEMTSSLGIDYRIKIYDASYSSSTVLFPIKDFELSYTPSDDTLLSPIITSELMIEMYDDGTSGIAAAISSIETSDEENVEVTLERDTGAGYELEWVGIVQKEGIVRYNSAKPVSITLRATDGLNLLKDIRYPGIANGTHTGSSQIMQFITECLKENGLDSFWGSGEAYIRESIEWRENNLSTPASDSPILFTRCDVLKFRNEVGSRSLENKTCYEVIEGICNLFGAQFFHANGCYYLRQPRNYDGATHTERELSKLLSELSSASVSNDAIVVSNTTTPTTDRVRILGGGSFMLREPLDQVRGVIKPGYLLPIDPEESVKIGIDGWDSGTATYTATQTSKTFTVALGTIYADSTKLDRFILTQNITGIQGPNHNIKLTWTVNLGGSYWLDHDPATNDFSWSGSSSSYVEIKPLRGEVELPFRVVTPPIPTGTYSSCTFTATVQLWDTALNAQITTTEAINKFSSAIINQQKVEVERPDDEYQWNFEVNVQNPQSNDNSKVLDLGEVWFNDTSVISTKSMFEVNTSGVAWETAQTWDAGYDADANLTNTMLYERMSYQTAPVRMYRGPIEGFYRPHLSFIYDSETYIMRRVSHMGRMDTYDGEWWKINRALNGITIGDKKPKDIPDIVRRSRGPVKFNNNDDRFFKLERIGELGETIGSGTTITSIDLLRQIGHDNIKDGDTIAIVHPLTGEILDEFECSADAGSTDTSISLVSASTSYDLNIGFYVSLIHWETKSADVIRGQEMRFKSATDIPFTDTIHLNSTLGKGLMFNDENANLIPVGEYMQETDLSNAQITSLNTTGVAVLSALGDNDYYWDVREVTIFYDHNGTEYTPTGNLKIRTSGTTVDVAEQADNIFAETSDVNRRFSVTPSYHSSAVRNVDDLMGQDFEIYSTGVITGAGGTARVRVYAVVRKS